VNSSIFRDTTYHLGIVIRRNDLIAVHCPGALRTSLQRWLDRPPRPQLERVEPAVLNGAFLTGEAKGLWLRGAQSPTAARPDSKQITGRRVQDSLNPFEDGGYALSSARAAFAGPPQQALTGTVGTTPRDSIVWSRSTVGFAEFVALTTDVLQLIEDIEAAGTGVEKPYPVLAERITSLAGVSGAFDIVAASTETLPAGRISTRTLSARSPSWIPPTWRFRQSPVRLTSSWRWAWRAEWPERCSARWSKTGARTR